MKYVNIMNPNGFFLHKNPNVFKNRIMEVCHNWDYVN